MFYGDTIECMERIAHYAKTHDIEFDICERDTSQWFVYGYNVSTLIPSRQSTTYVGVFPPNEFRHVWEWSNLGGMTPSKKECAFFDYICTTFQKFGSFCGRVEGILPSKAQLINGATRYMTRTNNGEWC